ncbi:hypothetical protein [Qaidamihabitans albus]|uniref:hypothetical protein n=1 Tax=Qaidamihabitans albus TaxID=2795733 RepID=UPI0018F2669A|nr:hypothetical protein [Qaidamihabitans albus]
MTDDYPARKLDRACDAVYQAQQRLFAHRRNKTIIVPDLYPFLGGLVALLGNIRDFLDTFPDLLAFDPGDHYGSAGLNPRESLGHADSALRDLDASLDTAERHLNTAWAHIGRIGLKTDETPWIAKEPDHGQA